jgi:hypothetical protein
MIYVHTYNFLSYEPMSVSVNTFLILIQTTYFLYKSKIVLKIITEHFEIILLLSLIGENSNLFLIMLYR